VAFSPTVQRHPENCSNDRLLVRTTRNNRAQPERLLKDRFRTSPHVPAGADNAGVMARRPLPLDA